MTSSIATQYSEIFSDDELDYLTNLPEVNIAREKIENGLNTVYFSICLPETIKEKIYKRIGLDLTNINDIPMRWIKGNSEPHIDTSKESFKNTHLIYLNEGGNEGQLKIGEETYPILKNTAYVFNEGVLHSTCGATDEPRLLLGPMSESGNVVGVGGGVYYFANKSDADSNTNVIGSTLSQNPFYVITVSGISAWKISTVLTTGSSNPAIVYNTGDTLVNDAPSYDSLYYMYPNVICFLEGSNILCLVDDKEQYIPIETMKPGTLVKTARNGYKKVESIGHNTLVNPGNDERIQDRLYKCSKENYPELTEDLYLTGCHSILVDELTNEQREKTIETLGNIFVTDKKYRLIACLDNRAQPWNSAGKYTTWHFSLEDSDSGINFGVYANGGLLVESCSIRSMKNKSNMTFV